MRYLLVLAGGGTGALARYVAASAIMTRFGGKFPLGTLAINVTGSFLIGFLMIPDQLMRGAYMRGAFDGEAALFGEVLS